MSVTAKKQGSATRPATVACAILALVALTFAQQVLPRNAAHRYSTQVIGVNEAQELQIRANLGDFTNEPGLDEQLTEKKLRAAESLQALGYYNTQISAKHATYKDHTAIQLFVNAGKPVTISTIELNILGDARSDDEFLRAIRKIPIRENQILDHRDYERTKDLLYSQARNLGFFNARFVRSQVLVTKKTNLAKIFIDFDTDKRHTIGAINYNTDLFDKDFLRQWQPFAEGIPYRASYAAKLTRNLQNSGYFTKVLVKPDLQSATGSSVPLNVELTPAHENTMSLGAGYATDTELRLKGSWLRPHHNINGHTVKGTTSLSRQRQEVSLSYQIPSPHQSDQGGYSLDVGILNHQNGDTFSQLRTAHFNELRLIGNNWYRNIFLRLENENSSATDDRIHLLLPGISFSRTLSSGGVHPDHGTFIVFKAFGGSTKLASDINMLRATASVKRLFSWNQKHYLITRADAGFLKTSDFNRVGASHRFFTGGDNSIRGFAYQSISPKNGNNESAGGKYLTNASIEYNYYFKNRWAIAAFADAGRAYNNKSTPHSIGVGAGVRWLSPVGPLRIDIGVGISEEDNPVRLHLAIGPYL